MQSKTAIGAFIRRIKSRLERRRPSTPELKTRPLALSHRSSSARSTSKPDSKPTKKLFKRSAPFATFSARHANSASMSLHGFHSISFLERYSPSNSRGLKLHSDPAEQTVLPSVVAKSVVGSVHIEEPISGFEKILRVKLSPTDAETFACEDRSRAESSDITWTARKSQRVKLICPRRPMIGSIHHWLPEADVGRASSRPWPIAFESFFSA